MKIPFPPKAIPVPTDMSTASQSALKYARCLHERFRSGVLVLHAQNVELPPYFSSRRMGDLRRELRKSIKAAAEYVRRRSESALGFAPEVSMIENQPAEGILAASRDNSIELVVMGMPVGPGEFTSSTTSSVMQLAVGPLLIVPAIRKENQEVVP